MHKDLSDEERECLVESAERTASSAFYSGESLALAREAWINAFDKAAAELDNA